MPRLIPLFAAVITALSFASALDAQSVSGVVSDSAGGPIADVRVHVVELNRATRTSQEGRYYLAGLARGTYTVGFSRIGFAPVVKRLSISDSAVRLDVRMLAARLELAAVQVTATSTATAAASSPQPTTVLEGTQLRTAQAPSLGETLEGLAGVRSLGMSTGIGKPVIRGLSSNRVVVLDDGQRLENQQWGSDHSPNIETVSSDRIEVIRGPASVLYGSDALGGVINVIPRPLPDAVGSAALLGARLTTSYASNTRSPEATLAIDGAAGRVGGRFSATARRADDMRAPDAVLFNSGNRTLNADGALGVRGAWGTVQLAGARRDERIEIFEDPKVFPGFSGYQRIAESRLSAKVTRALGASRLEGSLGWEQNRRREYDSTAAKYVALGLLARSVNAQATLHHAPIGMMSGTIGVSYGGESFRKFGKETLIPSTDGDGIAVFVFEQAKLGRLALSAGARYDAKRLLAHDDSVLRLESESRRWGAFTGNVGALVEVGGPFAVVANVGRGFRAPSAADLYANGYHEGTRAFERGDPTLGVETSLNVDLSLRANASRFRGEAGVFVNSIAGYIYLRPAGSGASALDTLDHTQGDARLVGIEAAAEARVLPSLRLSGTADYVRGTNVTTGVPLTFIPPGRVTYAARWERGAIGRAMTPYVTLAGETNASQHRLHPGDVGTAGYTLAHASTGAAFVLGSRSITMDVSARNVLDRRYRNFMSQYKTLTDAQGRNVVVRMGVSF